MAQTDQRRSVSAHLPYGLTFVLWVMAVGILILSASEASSIRDGNYLGHWVLFTCIATGITAVGALLLLYDRFAASGLLIIGINALLIWSPNVQVVIREWF